MSAFTDKLRSFFSKFAEVSHEELAKVEQAVEEKVQPLVNDVRDELKKDIATLEGDLRREIDNLKAQVEALLKGQSTPPAGS